MSAQVEQLIIELKSNVGNQLAKIDSQLQGLRNTTSNVNSSFKALGGTMVAAFGAQQVIQGVVDFGKASYDTAINIDKLKNSIIFASGSVIEGNKNLEFLNKTSNTLGLSLTTTYEGFRTLSGSMIGTGIDAEQTRKIFESVAHASVVMGLSSDDAKGAFLALGQMASKGTVSAEELRGQLGERLPGAFSIAARSMGVTTSQLGKMLQKGEVVSKDFLPKFSAELEKTFGKGLSKAIDSATFKLNKFNTSVEKLKDSFGKEMLSNVGGVQDELSGVFNTVSDNSKNISDSFSRIFNILKSNAISVAEAFGWMKGGKLDVGKLDKMIKDFSNTLKNVVPLLKAISFAASIPLKTLMLFMKPIEMIKNGLKKILEFFNINISFDKITKVFDQVYERISRIGSSISQIIEGITTFDVTKINQGVASFKNSIISDQKGNTFGLDRITKWKGVGEGNTFNMKSINDFAKNIIDPVKNVDNSNIDLKSGVKEIGSSGPRVINISINKVLESMNINTTNLTDMTSRIKDEVSKVLVAAVNDVNLIAQ